MPAAAGLRRSVGRGRLELVLLLCDLRHDLLCESAGRPPRSTIIIILILLGGDAQRRPNGAGDGARHLGNGLLPLGFLLLLPALLAELFVLVAHLQVGWVEPSSGVAAASASRAVRR